MLDKNPFLRSPVSEPTNQNDAKSVDTGSGRYSLVAPSLARVVVLKRGTASCVMAAPFPRSSIVKDFKTPERHSENRSRSKSSTLSSESVESASYQTANSLPFLKTSPCHLSGKLFDSPLREVCNKSGGGLSWRNYARDTWSTTIGERAEEPVSRSSVNALDLGRISQGPRGHHLRPGLRPLSIVASNGLVGHSQPRIRTTDRGQKSMDLICSMLNAVCVSNVDLENRIEGHLQIVTYELQARLNRIDSLEKEVQNAKRDVQARSIMISGLARERYSVERAFGADFSIIPELQAEIKRSEEESKLLREAISRLEAQLEDASLQFQVSEKLHKETKRNYDNLPVKCKFLELESERYRDNCKAQVQSHASEMANLKVAHRNDLNVYENKFSLMSMNDNETVVALQQEVESLRLSVRRLAMTSFRRNFRDRFSLNVDVDKVKATSIHQTPGTDAISLCLSTSTSATPSSPATPSTSIFTPTASLKSSWPDHTRQFLVPYTALAGSQKLAEEHSLIATLSHRSKADEEFITVLGQTLSDVEQQSDLAKAEVSHWRAQVVQLKDELEDFKMEVLTNATSQPQPSGSSRFPGKRRSNKVKRRGQGQKHEVRKPKA